MSWNPYTHLLTLAVLLLTLTVDGQAQEPRIDIIPDTIRVGDLFHTAIQLDLPPGTTLDIPDSLAISGDLENAGRPRHSSREIPGGGRQVTLSYPVIGWRPGHYELPDLHLEIVRAGEPNEPLALELPTVLIYSVLPADTIGVEPRPLKDVIGPSRLLWPWILGALSLAAFTAAAIYFFHNRMGASTTIDFEVALAASPRERALAELDQIRERGLVERGEAKELYTAMTAAIRNFLEESRAEWGTELTTTELLAVIGDEVPRPALERLGGILYRADQVKFNRDDPAPSLRLDDWTTLRGWVIEFEPEQREEEP